MSKSDNISKIEALEKEIDDNTSQKELLVKLMAKGYLEPALYNREKNELLMKKEKLTEQRDALIDDLNSELSKGQEVNNLIKYVNKAGSLKEFDDEAFDNHVEEIIVFSRQEIGFVLRVELPLGKGCE